MTEFSESTALVRAPFEEEDKAHMVEIDDGDGTYLKVIEFTPGEYHYPQPGNYRRQSVLNNFKVRPDDVWILGYMKAGTHWLWDVTHMLLKNTLEPEIVKEAGFLQFAELETLDRIASPRILNSHLAVSRLPSQILEAECRIILVIRNPKDVGVSYFHHYKKKASYEGTWKGFYNLYRQGKVPYGNWFDNVLPWWECSKNNPNVIVVKYEDMKRDLSKEVRRLAEFFGNETSGDRYDEIAEKCQFKAMKERKNKLPDADKTAFAYRKGAVGDWKNWFTVAQNEEFDEIYRDRMKDSDLEIDFTINDKI